MATPKTPPRRRRRSARSHHIRRRIGVGLLIATGFGIAGGCGAGIYYLPAIETAFAVTGQSAEPSPTPHTATTTLVVPTDTPPPAPNQPFTMLLLGSDTDAKFSDGVVLTQSMILARIDPVGRKVTMLSIPRDLYVPLPNGRTDKIDKAYMYGGAQAAIRTVEDNFHVHVDHYAWIGLQGLVSLIDKVGGVDVIASNPVLDDYYPADLSGSNPYLYDRVAVLPGPQHMDGAQALQYVRSRHGDLRGDFGRSFRQQQVLLALRAKAKLLTYADLPDVANAMKSDFKTDFGVLDVGSLLPIAGSVPLANVTQVVLLPPYTHGEMIGQQDVLIPNWNLILPDVAQYFPTS